LIIPSTKYATGSAGTAYSFTITNEVYEDWASDENYSEESIGMTGYTWWLRTPGADNGIACAVASDGSMYHNNGHFFISRRLGVRPALYINEGAQEKPVAEEESTANGYINDEGYYVFGLYEQDGDKSNGPEPIEWEILDENENGTLLISRYVLDSVLYDIRSTSEVTWEDCNLRSWMNDDFYNAAFDDEMKERINTVTITTEDNQYWETSGGNDTRDRIFALSVSESLKYYSFNSWDSAMHRGQSQELMIPATKYAKDREVSTITITENNYQFYSSHYNYTEDCIGRTGAKWWLRTPGKNSSIACIVDMYGQAGENGSIVMPGGWAGDVGVRPALYVNM
jgi:hypothetical protein